MTNSDKKLKSQFAESVDPDLIAYSTLWEDHYVLAKALDIKSNDNILSITSAGCNVLSMLLENPRSITAIDLNPSQTAFFKLKLAGIKYLEHENFLKLFGYIPSTIAWDIYKELEDCIDIDTREYFDERKEYFITGLCHCGKLEKYFRGFAHKLISSLANPSEIDTILKMSSLEDQKENLAKLFTPEFNQAFLDYFDQSNQSQHGRDQEKYKHVKEENIANCLLERFKESANTTLLANNFYTQYLLTGNYLSIDNSYPYLQKENFEKLKTLIHKVKVVTEEIEKHMLSCPHGEYTKANLSDIFEYMSQEDADLLLTQIAKQMKTGSRLAYWNLYIERNSQNVTILKRLDKLSQELKSIDRVWFYKNFHVDEVL